MAVKTTLAIHFQFPRPKLTRLSLLPYRDSMYIGRIRAGAPLLAISREGPTKLRDSRVAHLTAKQNRGWPRFQKWVQQTARVTFFSRELARLVLQLCALADHLCMGDGD